MNRVLLTGQLLERAALRYTPAGLPALDVRLAHASQVVHAGAPRQITLEVPATAIGEAALKLQRLPVGSTATFSGFLGRLRNGRGLMVHIQELVSPSLSESD